MSRFLIRFNKTRGQPGRGTVDHVWRVFDMGQCPPKEYLAKHVVIDVPCRSEKSGNGSDDFNFACEGVLAIDRSTGTLTVAHPQRSNAGNVHDKS